MCRNFHRTLFFVSNDGSMLERFTLCRQDSNHDVPGSFLRACVWLNSRTTEQTLIGLTLFENLFFEERLFNNLAMRVFQLVNLP